MTLEPVPTPDPPLVHYENGCQILSAEAAGLPDDVWAAMPRPQGWFIAVMQQAAPEKTKGNVYLPQQVQADRGSLDFVGRVVAIGPNAFKHPDFMVVEEYVEDPAPDRGLYHEAAPWRPVRRLRKVLPPPRCKVGDWVIFMRHEQLRCPIYPQNATASHEDWVIRFTTDRAVIAAAPRPEQLKVYLV